MDVYAQAGVIVSFRQFAKAQIPGHAGGDPVFQVSSNGYAIAKFSVATNEQKKNTQTGEYTENTSWHNAVAFDKLAEVVRDRVYKGDRVLFEGRLTCLQRQKYRCDRCGQGCPAHIPLQS
jgi:single stranded DNA-binding protein